MHWAVAGAIIAATAVFLQWLNNTNLGISTTFENLCSIVTHRGYFGTDRPRRGIGWRLPFAFGLLCGGVVSAWQTGGWRPIWDLGMFDAAISTSPLVKSIWMLIGGFLIGFGTRLAGGCTSGHAIYGLSARQKASLIAVLTFMATGFVTTNLLWRVIVEVPK
ncbi:MAG: hypothetical protein D6761_00130 [Candidatus Dadabacteria bacterium]|nr:MAG: hypothetical protein D6761_00130 [Candidatus Dadabacteria bacterium]